MKIKVNSDNEKLILTGGFTPNSGARIELYGKDSDSSRDSGKFIITAKGQTEDEAVNLVGSPAGILLWNNMEIIPCFTGLNHNGIYRGKNLGTLTSVEETEAFLLAHQVADGIFEDLYLGDYFAIQDGTYNKEWEIAGFDTYLHKGDTDFTTHHLALIPKENLLTSYMNSTSTAEGGYYNSYMHQTVIPQVNTNLTTVLGSHLLTRRALLSNAMTASIASMAGAGWVGVSTSWSWYDVKACLMSEVAVYGSTVFSSSFYDVGEDCERLPIFQFKGHSYMRQWFWLRAVANSSCFALADNSGCPNNNSAQMIGNVYPLICVG